MQNKVYIKRSNRKSIAIKINNEGSVFVYCPITYTNKKVISLLQEKQDWIVSHLKNIEQKNNQNIEFINYKKILFFGNVYDVIYDDNNKKLKLGKTLVSIQNNDIVKSLKQYLYKSARDHVLNRLCYWANIMKINYNRGELTSARKKWGSCDNKGVIRLNFRLIMLPTRCIDYVCIHELSHIIQLNHSTKFWSIINKYMPNYKEIKKEMKEYSFVLQLF